MASEKNGKGKTPEGGFFDSILRPLKKHRVTLTRAGKSLAPMRKRKATSKSLKKAKKPKAKAAGSKKKAITLLTRHERTVNELKALASIGRRDPERLAAIITRMLMDEDEMKERARQKYQNMLWKRAEKHGQSPDNASDAEVSE